MTAGHPKHPNPYEPPIEVTVARLEVTVAERFDALEKALALQAREYERRLEALNHEYARQATKEKDYVSMEKYEDGVRSESVARGIALDRIDENFSEHVKRYELRQREIDLTVQAQKNATDQVQAAAARAAQDAKDQAAKSAEAAKEKADAVERRANRNLVVAGLLISAIAIGASLLQNL